MKYRLIIDKNAEEEIVVTVHSPSAFTERIEDTVRSYTGSDSVIGWREDERRRLAFSEIECITVIDRKVVAIASKGEQYRIKDRLRDLAAVLPTYFIRINKSTLANEHRIERFHATFSGGVDAVFRCGYREYVSRRCFAEIKRRYEGR